MPKAAKSPFAQGAPAQRAMARTGSFEPITRSLVSTEPPLTGSMVNQYANARPAANTYGTSSGDRSRQAFAQAGYGQQRNQTQAAADTLMRQYRSQQERTRAADIAAQREDQVRRYGMDEDYAAKRRTQSTRRTEQIRDYAAAIRNARKSMEANVGEQLLGLGLSGFAQPIGAAVMENAASRIQGFDPTFGMLGDGFMGNVNQRVMGNMMQRPMMRGISQSLL